MRELLSIKALIYDLDDGDSKIMDMDFVELKFVKKDKIENRDYQSRLSNICLKQNCIIVAPTGLGKTIIAALFIAKSLIENEIRRFLLVAPTRVLVGQHVNTLRDLLDLEPEEIAEVTGEDKVEDRISNWKRKIVVATAEISLSDLEKGFWKPEEFYSAIFDEVHHAIGNHPYALLGRRITRQNPAARIVGFTASPPTNPEDQDEMVKVFEVKHVEVVSEDSFEVKKYFVGSRMEIVRIKPSPALVKIRKDLLNAMENIGHGLVEKGHIKDVRIPSLKGLLELRRRSPNVDDRSTITSLIRLCHCLDLVESHGIEPFVSFCEKIFLKKGRSAIQLRDEYNLKAAYETARGMIVVGEEHPKVIELRRILEKVAKDDRVIVFTNYKEVTKMLYEKAISWGLDAHYLIGKRGEFSQSQREQLETLDKLNLGQKKILFATRVGEEGLDIIECNLVIFYDSVPDAIRFVQRKGRTGRKKRGKVIVLVMLGSKEENLFWIGKRKVEKAKRMAAAEVNSRKLVPLEHYIEEGKQKIEIVVDKRESVLIKSELNKLNVNVLEEMLDIGDFILSEDVCVERKTFKDFVDSIIDGRLFSQLIQMKQRYIRPILLLENGSQSDRIAQNAFFGALASVVTDFGLPLVTTQSTEESALLLYTIAKREQTEKKKSVKIREGEKPINIREVQKYVLAGIPSVSSVLASRLLEKFGTLQKIFNSSEEDLMQVKGIGEVIARKIREVVTTNYNETLK